MTKKILLKWLEARKAEALAQVDTQETAAKAALLAEKLERTKFAEMVAYVEPRLTEVYTNFCIVNSGGDANSNYASSSHGVAFGFCV